MAGVITDACIKCKHMECVEVCPVDAFYEGENMLVINPAECVDCGCCIEQCPIDAIVFEDQPRAKPWLELNARYSKLWPNVTFDGGQTPADADQFHNLAGKFEQYFSPEPGKGDVGFPSRSDQMGHCSRCSQWEARTRRSILAVGRAVLVFGFVLGAIVIATGILFSFYPAS